MRTLKQHSDARVAAAASALKLSWLRLSKEPVEMEALASAYKAAADAAAAKPKPPLPPSPSRQQAAERLSRAGGGHTERRTTRVLVGGQVGVGKVKAVASKPIKEGWGPLRKGVKLEVPATEFGGNEDE